MNPRSTLVVDAGGTRLRLSGPGRPARLLHRPRPASFTPTVLRALIRSITRRRRPDHLIVGLRGVWTASERRPWARALRGAGRRIEILSDIELAHRAAFHRAPGIVLNAGTGSIAFGRDNRNVSARAGGWGPLLGDEGSGFWIGREWLRHEAQKGSLQFRKYVASEQPVRAIASLAGRILTTAAGRPASVEAEIARRAQGALAGYVSSVRRSLSWTERPEVVLCGSLFRNAWFRAGLVRALGKGLRVRER